MAKTVLIVEDNELNMKLFRDLLEAHGYQTSGTSNGYEALDLVRSVAADGASMVYHFMSDDDVERIMRHPYVDFASDSGLLAPGRGVPHPRGYGNAARVLGEYVRKRHVLPLEEAVRKMTSLPARHFRLDRRGLLKEGFAADVVVFDPNTIRDAATFEQPHQYAEGIPYVVVNGTVVVKKGEHTRARPGQALVRGGK